jgi:uncharacterized membrane protein
MVPDTSEQTDATAVQEIEAQLLQSAQHNQNIELKPEQASRIIAVLHKQSFKGPLPPPAMLREYEDIIPGFAQVLLHEIQAQGAAQRELQRVDVLKDHRRADVGQMCSLLIALCAIASAFWLGIQDANPWLAAVIATLGIGGLTAAAIFADGLSLRSVGKPHLQPADDSSSPQGE